MAASNDLHYCFTGSGNVMTLTWHLLTLHSQLWSGRPNSQCFSGNEAVLTLIAGQLREKTVHGTARGRCPPTD